MRKTFVNIISLLVLVSMMFAGCSPTATQAPAASTSAPAAPEATKAPDAIKSLEATKAPEPTAVPTTAAPVAIKIFSNQTSSMDLASSPYTKFIEEKFNMKITWDVTTSDPGSAKEKRQLALASGDYPDLFLLSDYVERFSQTDLLLYGQQGVFIPLNDLIDQYGPNIKAVFEKYPYYKAVTYAPDGNIYGIGMYGECYHCTYIQKTFVNTTWMKKLNIETPKTTDEFKAMLTAFKTKDPNGNGKADEIPMMTAIGQGSPITMLMNAYIYDDFNTHLIMQGGKVDINANKPEWKDGLLYVRSLVKEGLLDPSSFTQNWEAIQKVGNNDPEILGVGGLFPWYLSEAAQNDYWAIPPLTGPQGVQYAAYMDPVVGGASFVLTNKASKEAQIAAIKMLDYWYTQDGFLRALGEEGKDWRKPQAGEIALDKTLQPLYATIPLGKDEKPHNSTWEKITGYYIPKELFNAWVSAPDTSTPAGFERKLAEATKLYDGKVPKEIFPYWALWVDPTEADELAMLKQNITDYINTNALQFVTGTKSIEKDWDAYVAGFDKLNLNRYLAIMQKEYEQGLKK